MFHKEESIDFIGVEFGSDKNREGVYFVCLEILITSIRCF